MKDDLRIRAVFDAFIAAQAAFDDRVAEFKARYDAHEAALREKNAAGAAMAAQLAEVDRLAAELEDLGAAGPDIIGNEDMATQIRKGRELGELHAAVEETGADRN